MGMILAMLITVAISIGWIKLWTATYSPFKISGFIKHTVIFIFLSLIVALIGLFLIFSPVDDTYSASNTGALGLLFVLCVSIFCVACMIAAIQNLSSLLQKLKKDKQGETENINL
ncbi:MAG: hypothetical protein IJY85_02435 [Ruminococcus sp.]|nr:hypothetical protein [Ruminococcus sp.]